MAPSATVLDCKARRICLMTVNLESAISFLLDRNLRIRVRGKMQYCTTPFNKKFGSVSMVRFMLNCLGQDFSTL